MQNSHFSCSFFEQGYLSNYLSYRPKMLYDNFSFHSCPERRVSQIFYSGPSLDFNVENNV